MTKRTHVLTDDQPLEKLLAGAELLYKAVSTTMGPRGNNVIFRKAGKRVGVTHDGVTVAKAVTIDDPLLDVGAELLREAASKLDSTTGDGTTTVTVLTYHILKNAAELIRQGHNPMRLKLALEKLQDEVVEAIERHTVVDVTQKEITQVATIASGDATTGKEVGEIIYTAGKDTPVMLDVSETTETTLETINGLKLPVGPASPYLMEGHGLRYDLLEPQIIVCDAKLRSKEDIIPILRSVNALPESDRKFLLVTTDIAGDALNLVVLNHLKGTLGAAVARVPQGITSVSEYLQDIAIATGAKVLSRNTGHTIMEPAAEDFGLADKVVVEMGETVIVNGKADKEAFTKHLEGLKTFKAKNPIAKKFLQDRLSTLQQQVITIKVGGQSETEAEEKFYRYEDAIGASKAALRHGVVPGGGTLLYKIGKDLKDNILGKALMAPIEIVLGNTGVAVPADTDVGYGIDVMHPEDGSVNLIERGIIDPSESEIECVKTAITIAGLLMTSGAMIVDEITETKNETPTEFSINQG